MAQRRRAKSRFDEGAGLGVARFAVNAGGDNHDWRAIDH
jgi:hypothetical protein